MTTDEKVIVEVAPDGNVGVEETVVGLFVKTISVTYGRKFNLDNYESVTLDVTMWADRADDGDLDTDFAALWQTAKFMVKVEAMPLLQARNKARKAAQEAQKAKRPTPEPPTPAPLASSQSPTAPLGVTTPLPGQAPPTVAPRSSGVGQDKVETFLVDSVIALMTPKGNRNYAVRGGRVKKHGATMWPEVAEALEQITGYDPENLEIGQPWDVASFNITATAEIPEGKKYPTKVIGLTRGNGG